MATDKRLAPNIDQSDLVNFPNGRIKDNSGSGDGTPVNRLIYGDLHEVWAKLMRLAQISYNGLPDSEANGYQLVDALIALAGKNDFIVPLSSVGGFLTIPLNIGILKNDEMLICKASSNLGAETQIKGTGAGLYSFIASSNFRNGDYVLLIKTSSGFDVVRLADGANINTLVAENNFLKAATDAEEFTGLITTKATTPYSNQLAFARRVIGLDSGIFLASTSRNGLMSAADKILLASIENPVKNVGWFSGLDVGFEAQIGSLLPRSGDVVSATVYSASGTAQESFIRVVVANAMAATNYFVRIQLESEGSIAFDNDCLKPVFKKETNTQFIVAIGAVQPSLQSLKVHLEVVQIS